MKVASMIVRILLGIIFLVFGLNGFLHFIPMPPPAGIAGQFFGALFALQAIGGLLLLANRYVPLALTILGPIVVNILCFHALMAPAGLPLAIVVTAMWFIVFARNKQYFAPLFTVRTA
jgi:putative oxidoreductase